MSRQIESERSTRSPNEVKENRVPRDPPCPTRFRIERQAVAQKPEAHLAVLGTNWIVEAIIEIRDLREPLDRFCELLILLSTTASTLIDHTELTQAVVRRCEQIGIGLRLRESQSEKAPQVEFIRRRQAGWRNDLCGGSFDENGGCHGSM